MAKSAGQIKRAVLLLFWEVILGIILTAGSFLLFIKISGGVLEKDFLPLDMSILQFFYNLRTPAINNFMIGISYLGGVIMVMFGMVIAIFILLKKHRRESMLFVFIPGMAAIIDIVLKNLIQRPRPQFHPLVTETSFSFPSGHAMDSFVFYLTLSYVIFHITRNKKLSAAVTALSIILILLIGISRVYLGVHYPTDVLAGYAAGLFWFACVLLIDKTLIFYKLFKEVRR